MLSKFGMVERRQRRPFFELFLALLLIRLSKTAFSAPKSITSRHRSHVVHLLAASPSDKMGGKKEHLLSVKELHNAPLPTTSSCRRQTIAAIAFTIISAASFAPHQANADVTNKVASTSALRSLSNVQTQLDSKLKPLAQSNNYLGIKQCLREPPLDGMRKNMLILVRGGEDGPKAGDLLMAYKQLISALETLDATATLGMQGRSNKKDDQFLLSLQYEEVERALGHFVDVGATAASIPLQEDGNGKQTKVGSIDVRSGEVTPRVL